MQFSQQEVRIIKKAEKRIKQAVILRILAIVSSIALISLFFFGVLASEELAYSAFGLVMFAFLAPQLGSAPSYEKLVSILTSRLNDSDRT